MKRLPSLLAAFLLVLALPALARAQEKAPVVAAAADLQFALTEAADLFTQQTGKTVRLSFGSSGNFHRQIAEGGPYELYLSADETYVFDLAKAGLTLDEGKLYAVGRIVLIVPPGSPLKPDGSLKDLAAQLKNGTVAKFAIANPEHAPYGRAARSALKSAGLWSEIESKLILGENVSQAAQYATSGSAQGGIIAYSLALSPKVSALGRFDLIPADWHDPLRQRMALTKKAGATAKAFYEFLQSPPARGIFKRYGFVLPTE
ncbi:Molybdate ABC transporter substrate-binding protein [Rhodospirillaceae bacterium LM-1]|nr:Molybdate ABC transporter substrate-binding protein [Rhodospirillaceae bacterium LM-1]